MAHVLGGDARAAIGVAALGDDGEPVAVFARSHPFAKQQFALAIVLSGVDGVDAGGERMVEQGGLVIPGDHARVGAAKQQARDRARYLRKADVLHILPLPVQASGCQLS